MVDKLMQTIFSIRRRNLRFQKRKRITKEITTKRKNMKTISLSEMTKTQVNKLTRKQAVTSMQQLAYL